MSGRVLSAVPVERGKVHASGPGRSGSPATCHRGRAAPPRSVSPHGRPGLHAEMERVLAATADSTFCFTANPRNPEERSGEQRRTPMFLECADGHSEDGDGEGYAFSGQQMTDVTEKPQRSPKPHWRKWLRRCFLAGGVVAFTYILSGYRTVDVDGSLFQSDATVSVLENAESLQFVPAKVDTALVFLCGSGVSAHAYAPLLRPIAEGGFAVFVIKLPYRFAAIESHRSEAVQRALRVIATHPDIANWVVSGHSLGGALACRIARDHPDLVAGLVLVGTTYPKTDDLSSVAFPVTEVYASNDGIAPVDKVNANKRLLPAGAGTR